MEAEGGRQQEKSSGIVDAVRLLGPCRGERSPPPSDYEHKASLSRAIERSDVSGVADLLTSTIPVVKATTAGGGTVDAHQQSVLQHCLFAAHRQARRSRSGEPPPSFVYTWHMGAHGGGLLDPTSENGLAMIEFLLAACADPNTTDMHGLTVLHWLAQLKHDKNELVRLLELYVASGGNLEARDGTYGGSPLAWAAWYG